MNSGRWTRRHFLGSSAATLGVLGSPWRTLALPRDAAAAAGALSAETAAPVTAAAVTLPGPVTRPTPLLHSTVARRLRYALHEGGLRITNGTERFNRPLYAGTGVGRAADAGDQPEFRLPLAAGIGHLRLALARNSSGARNSSIPGSSTGAAILSDIHPLAELADVTALYADGRMLYTLRDPDLLGRHGELTLEALPAAAAPGLHLALSGRDLPAGLTFLCLFRAAARPLPNPSDPTAELRLGLPDIAHAQAAADCAAFRYNIASSTAVLVAPDSDALTLAFPTAAKLHLADATLWNAGWEELIASPAAAPNGPHLLVASLPLGEAGALAPQHIALHRASVPPQKPSAGADPEAATPETRFAARRAALAALSRRVRVRTPEPWIDAAVASLNVAAEALWSAETHSLVASAGDPTPSPGWSAPPGLDALGSHERVRLHLRQWFAAQNTTPLPPGADPDGPAAGPPDPGSSFTRKTALLHSNGDVGHSDRDCTLSLLEALVRHLRWTGDLALARELWPAFLRGMDWQYRLFRRDFDNPDRTADRNTPTLALYESYGSLSARDHIAYSGAGVAHSTARNLFLNREAAVLARVLNEDAVPFDTEAALLAQSMRRLLWQGDRGCFAEARDTMFPQSLLTEPGLWTATRILDAECVTPREAWQITAERLAALTPIPVHGDNLPEHPGSRSPFLLAASCWHLAGGETDSGAGVPGILFAENARMALALWQAGDADAAFALLRGLVLDSTARGLVPGNLHQTSALDPLAGETGIDSADSIAALARAIIEGLFGVLPDLLRATLTLQPGFPRDWTEAELHHPDLDLAWNRDGLVERFILTSRLPHPVALTLLLPARATADPVVLSNGVAFPSHFDSNATGTPRLVLTNFPPATSWNIEIRWHGHAPLPVPERATVLAGEPLPLPRSPSSANVDDPQACLSNGLVARPGHHAAFLRVVDGNCGYWLPIPLTIVPVSITYDEPAAADREPGSDASTASNPGAVSAAADPASVTAAGNLGRFEPVDLTPLLDSHITQIVSRSYRAPRSPLCSLALPEHLITGSPNASAAILLIDDTGLRAVGGLLRTASGVPFRTPSARTAPNSRLLSFWNGDQDAIELTLKGRALSLSLLMTAATMPQASRSLHGTVRVRYTDGTESALPLRSPETLWPIERDLFLDDFVFRSDPERPLPARVDLRTGQTRVLTHAGTLGQGALVPGGAASILQLPLRPDRDLAMLRVECSLYGVVLGLLAATLERL